jgi:UDP-N-acetylglucosamine diphosphorylase/glucosamine-1-phosphate N-acetyltransferase
MKFCFNNKQTENKNIVIIMAGGLGKRMKSKVPKVLHRVGGVPMLARIIEQAILTDPEKIFVVVGKYKPMIEESLSYILQKYNKDNSDSTLIEFVFQSESLGTGHAVRCCEHAWTPFLRQGYRVLIMAGDTPLVTAETMQDLFKKIDGSGNNQHLCITTTELKNPSGYGRIVRDPLDGNKFLEIVEEKDCLEHEKLINEVNCGIYVFDLDILNKYIRKLTCENAQKEYYLTDIVKIIKDGEKLNNNIPTLKIPEEKQLEIYGVNTREQLDYLNSFFKG